MPPVSSVSCSSDFAAPLSEDVISLFDSGTPETATSTRTSPESTVGNFTQDIVKSDNRMVTLVRAAVVIILLAAAVSTSFLTFKFTRDSERVAFDEAFQGVASKLAPGLVAELNLRLWQARSVASSVKAQLRKDPSVPPHLLTIDKEDWEDATEEAIYYSRTILASWNPLLRLEQERIEFEEMVKVELSQKDEVVPCFVCGSADRSIANREQIVEIPGFGPLRCGQVEDTGLSGLLSPERCQFAMAQVEAIGCACVDVPSRIDQQTEDEFNQTSGSLLKIEEDTGDLISLTEQASPPYMPYWSTSSIVLQDHPILLDHMSVGQTRNAAEEMIRTRLPMFSKTIFHSEDGKRDDASVNLYFPVEVEGEVVGSVSLRMGWSSALTSVIPRWSDYVDVVIENTCGQNFTFVVDPEEARLTVIGEGDFHEAEMSSVVLSSSYEEFDAITVSSVNHDGWTEPNDSQCRYKFHVFATKALEEKFITPTPIIFGCVTAAIFLFTSAVFIMYDFLVQRAQKKVVDSAKQTTDIVSSLFPTNVRDRMFNQARADLTKISTSKMKMNSILFGTSGDIVATASAADPIADLFASATVMFFDIQSFTAWSSEREPSQVFLLLETVYQSFDEIASKLNVFKVETIGDSYVAVCGLPKKRKNHAPIMVEYAHRCLLTMRKVTKALELRLGPSTADLQARVGLHSGPVTAGVLRGEKARFQLFGDTVNMASRLQSSGHPSRIHVSQETVDLLEVAGKGHWAQPRAHLVSLKGKGDLQTYFVQCVRELADVDASVRLERDTQAIPSKTPQQSKSCLVDWNTEVLYDFLKRIVFHRNAKNSKKMKKGATIDWAIESRRLGELVIDELTETLSLPTTATNTAAFVVDDTVKIAPEVKQQLREFVKRISDTYRDVPFHNFEHCSHVLMSTSKLMKRIVTPEDVDYHQKDKVVARAIHETTYGISSDPILQFAALFAALIHDVDHTGLTNAELIVQKVPLAAAYQNQSVAEQNSVDMAWSILLEPTFRDLRRCIYGSDEKMVRHFRQLVVNAVMATDIADKQLKQAREARWEATFKEGSVGGAERPIDEAALQNDRNRKATIVFEYIIQASDICHTMQHWHTYQKFNKRLFEERYVAWLHGSLAKEPSLGWYGGELWFFDNYIIPLANKLDKCGVFGVSYHEYLTYAKENRKEWVQKGKSVVTKMKQTCDRKYAVQLAQKTGVQPQPAASPTGVGQ